MNPIAGTPPGGMSDAPAVPIQVNRGVVLASVQTELADAVLARLRADLLQRIHDSGVTDVILDLSGVRAMDSHEFQGLRALVKVCGILGARTVLAGLRPGVVSALVLAGADVDGLDSAIDLDQAYEMLQPAPAAPPEPAAQDESEAVAHAVDGAAPEYDPESGAGE